MTRVEFLTKDQKIYGFVLKGHSSFNCDDFEGKLVCSAVSSAAYMAANTLIEVLGESVEAKVSDAKMKIIANDLSDSGVAVLEGFKLHLTQLSVQYPENIMIISEV